MASKKQFRLKGVREDYYPSVVRYNIEHGTNLRVIAYGDDDNVTDYKCRIGYDKTGKALYLKEFFTVMWGNDEVELYCDISGMLQDFSLSGDVRNAEQNGRELQYTEQRGMFGRWHYNVLITIDGVRYYMYIKTIRTSSFARIMKKMTY